MRALRIEKGRIGAMVRGVDAAANGSDAACDGDGDVELVIVIVMI